MATSKEAFIKAAAVALLLGAIWLGLYPLAAVPAVVPASAPADRFSAERAMPAVKALAANAHPIGSPEQAAARDYLVTQIRAMGLEPAVWRATIARSGEIPTIAAVENVLVRLPGRERGPAVLISGHYDSVPTGPGAYDCAGCVATVLETLRAIHAGPQLRNDVIFLFTDGEEVDAIGAQAFAEQHPWARDVALNMVYEGYGSTGAGVLYGTGSDSGWTVSQALSTGTTGYSFLNEIMGLLGGTSSDMDPLVRGGQQGLAFIALSLKTAPGYHTWDDNLANFDARMLQSHGDHAVGLVRRYGDMPLDDIPRQPNATYFTLFPGINVYYPSALALPLAIGALLLYLAVVVFGAVRRRVKLLGVLAGAGGWLLCLVASLALVTAAWMFLRRLNPNLQGFRIGTYDVGLYLLAFIALAAAITWAVYSLARRRFAPADLVIGALAWWAILGILLAETLPGVSYAITWPLLVALLVAGWRALRATPLGARADLLWVVPAAIGLALMVPLIYFVAILAGRMEALIGLPMAALPLLFALPLLGLSLPMVEMLAGRRRAWLASGALALCIALLIAAGLRSAPSPARPSTNTVVYRLETADEGIDQASWITVNDSRAGRGTGAQLDVWTAQFFPNGAREIGFNPWPDGEMDQEYPALQGPAALPAVRMPRGTLAVEDDEGGAGVRHLRLHLTLAPQALEGQVVLSAGAQPSDLTINGQRLAASGRQGNALQVNVNGRFAEGIVLEFNVPADGSLAVTLTERTMGLPAIPGAAQQPRPATMVPAPFNRISDSTLVSQSWRLD